jgi:hypothetical protein
MEDARLKKFLAAVDDSFLSEKVRKDLRAAAEFGGVTQRLWERFNDALIEEIVRRHDAHDKCREMLDAEIDRFTIEYEREKTALDYRLRDDLKRADEAGDAAEKDRLWVEYRSKIADLQAHVRADVNRTSVTCLHEVVLATARLEM